MPYGRRLSKNAVKSMIFLLRVLNWHLGSGSDIGWLFSPLNISLENDYEIPSPIL